MGGVDSWRQPVNLGDRWSQMEKKILSESRRPQIERASDLLGPGAGPYAVQIKDWNADEAVFVGVFYADPNEGQVNSPDDSKFWMGETFGTQFGDGFQRLTEFFPVAIPSPGRYERRFTSTTGVRVYSAWVAL